MEEKVEKNDKYDDIDDDEYESVQSQHNKQQQIPFQNKISLENGEQNCHSIDKNEIQNLFKNDPELENIQVEILDQTSKTDWQFIYQITKYNYLQQQQFISLTFYYLEYIYEHTTYTLKSYQQNNEQNFIIVQRRYSDFEWLYKEFEILYIGIILPPLPEKSAYSKINLQVDLTNRADFFEDRLIGLKTFLKKVLQHPKLSETKEFKSFIKDNDNEFTKFKERSFACRPNGQTIGSGVMKMVYNSVSNSLTTAVGYISGTRQKRERERTSDDEKFETYEKYYTEQKEKIAETTKCFHYIFEFKKKQSENMESISTALEKLEIQQCVTELKETAFKASECSKKNSKDFNKSIEGALIEQIKHFDSCLSILNHRKELLKRIFENQQKIEQYRRQAGKQEEVSNLNDEIDRDEMRLDKLQYLFIEDSEYFNQMIQYQINDIIKQFSDKSIEYQQLMARIWQNQN